MADKLILNANMICKADRFNLKNVAVEKVIEVSDSEFKRFTEKPMERNYYLSQYKELMGFYDESYHGVLFVNRESGDGLLVNSEGYDYARYSQYIPNARDIVQRHEQSLALDDLKIHMDCCINRWLEQYANEDNFSISLTDLIDNSNLAEIFVDYASDVLCGDPRIENCELTHNSLEVTKSELVATRLYCPLKFEISNDDGEYPYEVCSADYTSYDEQINEIIDAYIKCDEEAVERGLAAYFHDENLDKKVYSIFPSVEVRNGDLYGVFTVKSYGELNQTEMIDVVEYAAGQAADGWGEGFEQQDMRLGEDNVYISFWNSDDYFMKPENEVFPEPKFEQTMGGI